MSDAPDNLVLELLRAIRGDLAALRADVADIKERLDAMEGQVIGLSGRQSNPTPFPKASP